MIKSIVLNRIVDAVREYNLAFNAACPMHILSAHYSRACKPHGGFTACIGELKASGQIYIFLIQKTGGKVCVAVDVNLAPENAVKV